MWSWYLLTAYLALVAADAAWSVAQLARPALNPAWAAANLDEKQVGRVVMHSAPASDRFSASEPGRDSFPIPHPQAFPLIAPKLASASGASQTQCSLFRSCTTNCVLQAALWGLPATATLPKAPAAGGQRVQQQQRQFQAVTPLVSIAYKHISEMLVPCIATAAPRLLQHLPAICC